MGAGRAAVVIDPRSIVRAAFASLLGALAYRVVGSAGSAADIVESQPEGGACEVAIVGAQSAEEGADEGDKIRRRWTGCKILLLLESPSSGDIERLIASQIDGCVPLNVTVDTLRKTLDMIMVQRHRVMVASGEKVHVMRAGRELERSRNGQCEKVASIAAQERMHTVPVVAPAGAAINEACGQREQAGNAESAVNDVPSFRKRTLSEREVQILDGLVKGHSNKAIARACDISEATVKVHMKSILRKIRVTNRTQAAVWALEHRYGGHDAPEFET